MTSQLPLTSTGPVVALIDDGTRLEWDDPTLREILTFEAVTGLDYNGQWWASIRGAAGYVYCARLRTEPDLTWDAFEGSFHPGRVEVVVTDALAEALDAAGTARPTIADPA